MKYEIDGVVRFSRSERSSCVCCQGNHIYGRSIRELDTENHIDIESLILRTLGNKAENKRIKIAFEVIKQEGY